MRELCLSYSSLRDISLYLFYAQNVETNKSRMLKSSKHICSVLVLIKTYLVAFENFSTQASNWKATSVILC